MMDFIKQYSTFVWFIAIVAVMYGAYLFFFAEPKTPVVTASSTQTTPDADLVALLFELKNIRLDNAIFEDPLFQSLKDFSQSLVSEPTGRNNPFAPLGGNVTVNVEVTKPKTPSTSQGSR